jgi:hypothetical protein
MVQELSTGNFMVIKNNLTNQVAPHQTFFSEKSSYFQLGGSKGSATVLLTYLYSKASTPLNKPKELANRVTRTETMSTVAAPFSHGTRGQG